MKRYPKYKPSNIPRIGELPDHWEIKKFKYCTIFINGYSFTSTEYTEEGIPVIRIGDIQPKINLQNCKRVPYKYSKTANEFRVIKDDILLALTGATIGKSSIYDLDDEALLNQRVAIIRSQKKLVIQAFTKYIIDSYHFREHINLECAGGAQENIGKPEVGFFSLTLPSTDEQLQIAAYLDSKTQKIDKLISNKQKQIELLKEERQSIINNAVTGRVVIAHARGVVSAEDGAGVDGGGGIGRGVERGISGGDVADATAAKEDIKFKPSGIPWLGDIPEHWEVKKLKYIAYLKSGEFINAENICPVGDFPVLGGNGLRGYTNTYTHKGNFILIGRQGALCGNINLADGKFYATEHAVVVTILDESDTIWLSELLRTMDLNQYSQASAQPGLSVETIKNLPIPFPPYAEQKTISLFLSQETKKINFTISKIEKEISLLQEYRTALISEVVIGKLDVREELVS